MSFLSDNLFGILISCIILLIFIKLRKKFSYFTDRGLLHITPTWKDIFNSFSIDSINVLPLTIYERKHGDNIPYIGFFRMMFEPSILVLNPSLVERIMIKDFSHFSDHGFHFDFEVDPLFGHLFHMKGDQWRTLRHKLVPTFTSGKLKGMVPIIEECADKIIQEMKQDASLRQETNLKELFKSYSLAVIASCAFGIDPESIKDPKCQFRQILQEIITPNFKMQIRFVMFILFPFILRKFKVKIFKKEIEDFFLNLTNETFEMRKKSGVKRNDFIQLLLELKEKGSVELDVRDLEQDEKDTIENMKSEPTSTKLEFTDKLLMAQIFVFLLAGFDNSAFLAAITTYCLCKHPESQRRVREEVLKVKSKYGCFDYQALKDMKLLEASINEALRIYPPIAVLTRECTKTYTLDDGKKLEKGMSITLPTKALHNDTRFWKNPEEFNPDRFLGETIKPGTYLPFGDGPRICIAQRLALLTTKLMLAKLVENFDLQPSTKTKEPLVTNTLIGTDGVGGIWGSFKDL